MPPQGTGGKTPKPTKAQVVDKGNRSKPIPVDLGIGKATASIQKAAKTLNRAPSPPQLQALAPGQKKPPPLSKKQQQSIAEQASIRIKSTKGLAMQPSISAPIPYQSFHGVPVPPMFPYLPGTKTQQTSLPITNPKGTGVLDAPNLSGIIAGKGGNPYLAGFEAAGLLPFGKGAGKGAEEGGSLLGRIFSHKVEQTAATKAGSGLLSIPERAHQAEFQAIKDNLAKVARDIRSPQRIAASAEKTIPGVVPPKGVLFHGSPEGVLKNIDTYYHTKPWKEGIGFYITEDLNKAKGYAAGRTASAARKVETAGKGAVNYVKLMPGAKVLDMNAPADMNFWRNEIAPAVDHTPQEFDQYVLPHVGKNPTNQDVRRELIDSVREELGPESVYAIEEAYAKAGIQATTHLEGLKTGTPHRVWVVKDEAALQHVGGHTLEELSPKVIPATESELRHSLVSQQAKYLTAQRAERFSKASEARKAGGTAGAEAAKAQLAGEYNRIPLPEDMIPKHTGNDVEDIANFINNHPFLSEIDKTKVADVVDKVSNGILPQKAEAKLMERAFGGEIARLQKPLTSWMRVKSNFYNAANFRRAIMTAGDISGTFRQALQAGMRHPGILWQNMGPQLKAFKSEDYYNKFIAQLNDHPLREEMKRAGVRILNLGSDRNLREEAYQSQWADKVPFVKGSGRAYTALLDGVRVDLFEHLYTNFSKAGVDVHDQHFLESLGELVNNATGQGGKSFGKHAASLNVGLWSPRLLASRVNLFNPLYYAHLHPAVRAEALRQLAHLSVAIGGVTGLAIMAGAKVNLDPRSSDFLKIRLGKTRIDTLGGFQQPFVFGAREVTGEKINSAGQLIHLKPGIGNQTRLDVGISFARGKLNPTWQVPTDWAAGQNLAGQPFSWTSEVGNSLPLAFQDAYNVATSGNVTPNSLAAGVGGGALSALGVGVQSYGARDTGATTKQRFLKQANDVKAELNIPKSALDEAAKEADIKGKVSSAIASAGGRGHSVQKLKNLLTVYKQVTGHDLPNYPSVAVMTKSEADANAWLDAVKGEFSGLTANYDAWNAAIQQLEDAKLGK